EDVAEDAAQDGAAGGADQRAPDPERVVVRIRDRLTAAHRLPVDAGGSAAGARLLDADAGAGADRGTDRRGDAGAIRPRFVPARLLEKSGAVRAAAPRLHEQQDGERCPKQATGSASHQIPPA